MDNIKLLDDKMTGIPQPPSGLADVPGKEIRSHVAQQKSPIDFVMKNISNLRVVAAVLSEEPFLSGLSQTESDVIKQRAISTLHPAQAAMKAKLTKAFDEAREFKASAQRLVLERCEMRADDDGQFRSIHEAPPRGKLTVVPSQAAAAAGAGAEA